MNNYKYIAKDLAGRTVNGVSSAISKQQAMVMLREKGFIPIEIIEASQGEKAKKRLNRRKRVTSSELASFCWQLCTMVEGGIPLISAMETIGEDCENRYFQSVLGEIIEYMQAGDTLYSCVSHFPKVFDTLFCSLIMAGETGGSLPATLTRLGEYYDSRDKLARKVKSAMAYPIFVFGFVIFLVTFIMVFIIPRFREIFESIGGELPMFTQMFMGVYDAIAHNLPLFFVLMLMAIGATILYYKTENGWRRISKIILKIPLIGKVKSQAFIAMFSKTFATMLAAGVSVLDTLEILAKMSNNAVIKDAIVMTRAQIIKGSSISASMAEHSFFPNVLTKMVSVGEQSGSLPDVLDKTCAYYERRVETTITTIMSVLEPALIVTVGGIVLMVVLALYLPIFTMSDVKQ
jgi:type IV pilus assembly protein PilC